MIGWILFMAAAGMGIAAIWTGGGSVSDHLAGTAGVLIGAAIVYAFVRDVNGGERLIREYVEMKRREHGE